MKTTIKKTKTYDSPLVDNLLAEISPAQMEATRIRMHIAMKIAEAINKKGLSRREFAQLMNQNPSAVTRWLSGTHNFTIDTLVAIQNVLGVDLLHFGESGKEKYATAHS
jgi:ribosome-binding protein aMBF1 (putative translation factor)